MLHQHRSQARRSYTKRRRHRRTVLIIGVLAVCILAFGLSQLYLHTWGDAKSPVLLDGQPLVLNTAPKQTDDTFLLPAREILEALGCSVSQDAESGGFTADHQGRIISFQAGQNTALVNRRTIQLSSPILEENGTAFLPSDFLEPAVGAAVQLSDDGKTLSITSPKPRETLQDITVPDTYRLTGERATYNGVTIIDGVGMELLHVSDEQAVQYADIINAIAASLPESVNCYNLLVPTMAEFYAPAELYPNYTQFMRTVYSNLELNVTPVDLITPLLQHAAEPIFFTTDHHWTQRGAYYAYEAYLKHTGGQIDPLDTFENQPAEDYRGSLVNFTNGTAGASLLGSDRLERFLPKVEVTGTAYSDAQMTQPFRSLKLVDTDLTTYECFIEGDVPVAVFQTGTKNGKKLAVIKESYGNAFVTWAVNNYEEIYVIDFREFNGDNAPSGSMKIADFYDLTQFDDLVIISYPVSVASVKHRQALAGFAEVPPAEENN